MVTGEQDTNNVKFIQQRSSAVVVCWCEVRNIFNSLLWNILPSSFVCRFPSRWYFSLLMSSSGMECSMQTMRKTISSYKRRKISSQVSRSSVFQYIQFTFPSIESGTLVNGLRKFSRGKQSKWSGWQFSESDERKYKIKDSLEGKTRIFLNFIEKFSCKHDVCLLM